MLLSYLAAPGSDWVCAQRFLAGTSARPGFGRVFPHASKRIRDSPAPGAVCALQEPPAWESPLASRN
jgi:hypothetical protein